MDEVNKLLTVLCRCLSTRKLYFADHPKVVVLVKEFSVRLRDIFAEIKKKEFFIGLVDNTLIYEGKSLVGPTVVGKQLVTLIEHLQCGGILFRQEATTDEVKAFLELAIALKEPVSNVEEGRALLQAKGIKNIEIAHHFIDSSGSGPKDKQVTWRGQDVAGIIRSPTLIYQALFDVVAKIHGNSAFDRSLDIDEARTVSEFMLNYTRSSFADVMQYIHYPDYDAYTVGHSVRVATLAVFIGKTLKWNEEPLLSVGTAGLLHDVGKSKIDNEILYKPQRLTQEEIETIQTHPRVGVEILLSQKDVSKLELAATWGHHIRHDGKGYPPHPVWGVRHPVTALLQVCDVFEALTAVRPYKLPLDPQEAYAVMLQDSSAFHPGLLASFISIIGIYPPGSFVKLSDGRTGMVTETGSRLDKPIVKIIESFDRAVLPNEDQYSIDLSSPTAKGVSVSRLLRDYL